MTDVFPFNMPETLNFYIVVYVATLVLHAVFMTYVLAGSSYVAWATLFPGSSPVARPESPLVKILREWMPFVLSAAITAGVAPLLFVQIIYRQEFYTANLLLGWRWLVVIPVLTAAFYLLYVLKSKAVTQWSFPARCAVAISVAGCFLFVAFCWTTNHTLQLGRENWPSVYQSGSVVSAFDVLVFRLLTWYTGAFPLMSVFAGWQLIYYRRTPGWETVSCDQEVKPLSRLSLMGLGIAVICAIGYVAMLPNDVRADLTASAGITWVGIAAGGVLLQAVAWFAQLRGGCFCRSRLALASVGGLFMLTGSAMIREMIRIAHVDTDTVIGNVSEAADVGGFSLFLVFTVVNGVLIWFCLHLTGGRKTVADPHE